MKINEFKRGISLIILTVTIIVMAILAGIVITNLSSNNTIDEANTAVTDYNAKLVREQIELMDSKLYLKQKQYITEENKESLEELTLTENIPMNILFVYIDKTDNTQYVLFNYTKATAAERTKLLSEGYGYLIGDVDADNDVDQDDYALTRNFAVSSETPTTEEKKMADIDGDSSIDVLDVFAVQSFINGHASPVRFE